MPICSRYWFLSRAAGRCGGAALLLSLLAGCRLFGGQAVPAGGTLEGPGAASPRALLDRYVRAGMLAAPQPVSFVGAVRGLAGRNADSTLALVMLSLPTRALNFIREGDRYRASYEVVVEFRQAEKVLRRLTARQAVRVGTFTETIREDESVVFQEFAQLAPGSYEVSVVVRDSVSGSRSAATAPVSIPRFDGSRLAAPITVYQATARTQRDSLPELVTNPRATVVAERDTALRVYVEGYGLPPEARFGYLVQDERGRDLLRDSLSLAPEGRAPAAADSRLSTNAAPQEIVGQVLTIRLRKLGPGLYWLGGWRMGASDTTWVPFFVLQGEGMVGGEGDTPAVANARFGAAQKDAAAVRR